MSRFQILQQTADWVAIDKPEGLHVHPPEVSRVPIPREKIVLHQLRDQLGQYVYPVHRLDAATSGVLVFALNSDAAREMCRMFEARQVRKKYWAVARGWMAEASGTINRALESDSSGELVEADTRYSTLAKWEYPAAVGKRFSTARYSWLEVEPVTGRYRQIRRHMNRVSHPLIGDGDHGDSHHNRFFREQFGVSGLCLRCVEMGWSENSVKASSNEKWDRISELFKTGNAISI